MIELYCLNCGKQITTGDGCFHHSGLCNSCWQDRFNKTKTATEIQQTANDLTLPLRAEIAALKAENERLRGEKSILERGIDIELKASRRSDHHMQQKIWLVNELLSQIQPEQLTTVSKIKDILGSGTRENRSRPDLYADILEQKEMLLCEAAEAEAQAECERRNKDGNA